MYDFCISSHTERWVTWALMAHRSSQGPQGWKYDDMIDRQSKQEMISVDQLLSIKIEVISHGIT